MSTHSPLRTNPISIQINHGTLRVEIEWGVSRRALGDLAPAGSALLVTLSYSGKADSSECWRFIDPLSGNERAVSLPPESVAAPEILGTSGMVRVQSPGMYALISIENPEPVLLYARTPIFATLGIPGGRYQPKRVRLNRI